MPNVTGQRNTYQSITANPNGEGSLVRQVDDQIVLLEPNETPLVTLLMKLGKRVPVYSPRFEWYEDDFVARWTTTKVTSATGTATGAGSPWAAGTSLTVDVADGTAFVVGDMFAVPSAISSSTPPAVCRVTANSGTQITFTTISTLPAALTSNQALRLIGPAHVEGDTPPESKSTIMTNNVSYTQIFRSSLKLTKTQASVKQYGKPNGERKYEQKKKLIEHKAKLNAAALFGKASESVASSGPLRTTQGILNTISTNKQDGGGSLTQKTFEAFCRQVFRYGSQKKLLLAAPIVVSALNYWANQKLFLKQSETAYGVDLNRIVSGHGEFLVARDWMLENNTNFGGMAIAIDLDNCGYFYLQGNGESRDTRIIENAVQDGRDAYVDEILTEGGFYFKFEKKHGLLYNVTDFA